MCIRNLSWKTIIVTNITDNCKQFYVRYSILYIMEILAYICSFFFTLYMAACLDSVKYVKYCLAEKQNKQTNKTTATQLTNISFFVPSKSIQNHFFPKDFILSNCKA